MANIRKKIIIYNWISWMLIGLTILLAFYYTIEAVKKDGVLLTTHILGFFTEIILQPYFWVALILRWRIRENKKAFKTKEAV